MSSSDIKFFTIDEVAEKLGLCRAAASLLRNLAGRPAYHLLISTLSLQPVAGLEAKPRRRLRSCWTRETRAR
jgi:hypothetical protein